MKRLLVANRGEIAVRVIQAARDLGIETVAVYSAADEHALHVRLADQALPIGPSAPTKSYLRIEALLDAAREAGADAVHPGYGFLAEQSAFAQACADAGLLFVGPSPEVIDLMGNKVRGRDTARAAGVPVIPGSDGPVGQAREAVAAAAEIGYPVLLKAAGGGGGRGIRLAGDETELRALFPIAATEARAAFGDPRLYVERHVTEARHVEVQIFGDRSDVVHLFERDCSLQRRRQKVVEEAPAPGIPEEVRAALCGAAVRIGQQVGYLGAGTVEMLVDDLSGQFFFMEMNTRIQVEHPTTELVCGVDLVAEQLRVAAGERLSFDQASLRRHGVAIELRVCAEDPVAGLRPSPGTVEQVRWPSGPWVRVDTWLDQPSEVTPFYDSLLAKIITWGTDRTAAISRARRALAEAHVSGVPTNLPLLRALLDEPWFERGQFHTGTLEPWLATWANGLGKE